MADKYLLYIDILGFESLVWKDKKSVEMIYKIINTLNAHRHSLFDTIVFSDTILVYNKYPPQTEKEHKHLVWCLIEFAEDLRHRLTGLNIFFRAILTKGEFEHYQLSNLQAFFGPALINAYHKEKDIPSLGLFIDRQCGDYNEYYPTRMFDHDVSFVYLCRDIKMLIKECGGNFPVEKGWSFFFNEMDNFPWLIYEVEYLKSLHHNMNENKCEKVRLKHQSAWDYYYHEYGSFLDFLTANDFSLDALCPGVSFLEKKKLMMNDIRYFCSL
ncbi:hypothetical protein RY966_003751 [Enterobacter kobei]|nr:hypothetical protein [Enterobacter kobei]